MIKNGIHDWDLVHAMTDAEQIAWCVMFSQFQGGEFNWETMSWIHR